MFADSPTTQNTPVFSTCLTGEQLLQSLTHRQSWQAFRECIPISDEDFDHYYTAVLKTFAEYVQTLPASQHVFYAMPAGFLQLGLDRAITATKLALQSYHDFEGLTPDQLTVHDLIELFAVFSAALLSDLGLLIVRFQIKINDHSSVIADYDPYAGSIFSEGKSFSYQFRPNELMDWPAPASLVLARQIMSQTQNTYRDSGFAWISRYHDILQLWYAMLLDLTPAQESSTRRRFLLSLIPTVDNDMVHQFLINIHNSGNMLPGNRQNPSLFNIQNPESVQEIGEGAVQQESEKDVLEHLQKNTGFEKIFGGNTFADASNALMPGSVSASIPPLLRYGLAFLGWLLIMARTGHLYAGSDGPRGYGLPDGKVAFDVQQLQQLFSKEANFPAVSAQDLLTALQKIQVLQAQKISLSELAWKNDPATQFTALILPVQFVFGNLAGPKIALGLAQIANAMTPTENKQSSLFGRKSRNLFTLGG